MCKCSLCTANWRGYLMDCMENHLTVTYNNYTYISLYNSTCVQGWTVLKSLEWARKSQGWATAHPCHPKVHPWCFCTFFYPSVCQEQKNWIKLRSNLRMLVSRTPLKRSGQRKFGFTKFQQRISEQSFWKKNIEWYCNNLVMQIHSTSDFKMELKLMIWFIWRSYVLIVDFFF